MDVPGRRFLCAACRTAVLICSHCDRGHRYCTAGCAEQVRQRAVRDAGRRYQDSLRGRHAHAERQRRYRARQPKVTHQGSPPGRTPDQLPSEPTAPMSPVPTVPGQCCRCHRPLPDWVRQDFLRSSVRRNPPDRRKHDPHPRD